MTIHCVFLNLLLVNMGYVHTYIILFPDFDYIWLFYLCWRRITVERLNTDGSFTMAVSNSFLSPLEKQSYSCTFELILDDVLFYLENGILCVILRIASIRRFK